MCTMPPVPRVSVLMVTIDAPCFIKHKCFELKADIGPLIGIGVFPDLTIKELNFDHFSKGMHFLY